MSARFPPTKWAQRKDRLLITFCVEDCDETLVEFYPNKIIFHGVGGYERRDYHAELELFKEIYPQKCKWEQTSRSVSVYASKKECGPYWPRMLHSIDKQHWLKVDFDKIEDEDDSDSEDAGNFAESERDLLECRERIHDFRHGFQEDPFVEPNYRRSLLEEQYCQAMSHVSPNNSIPLQVELKGNELWQKLKDLRYRNPSATQRDVDELCCAFPNLQAELRKFTPAIGKTVLCISGTVPVTFSNNLYHFPIAIWVVGEYPASRPLCYIKPTDCMALRPGRYVDLDGKVRGPYLNFWTGYPQHNLIGLVHYLIDIFSQEPPVVAKTGGKEVNENSVLMAQGDNSAQSRMKGEEGPPEEFHSTDTMGNDDTMGNTTAVRKPRKRRPRYRRRLRKATIAETEGQSAAAALSQSQSQEDEEIFSPSPVPTTKPSLNDTEAEMKYTQNQSEPVEKLTSNLLEISKDKRDEINSHSNKKKSEPAEKPLSNLEISSDGTDKTNTHVSEEKSLKVADQTCNSAEQATVKETFRFYPPARSIVNQTLLIRFINQSPEHLGKLEQDLKEYGIIKLRNNHVEVQITAQKKKNGKSPKTCSMKILREFFSEFSVQTEKVEHCDQKVMKSGSTMVIKKRVDQKFFELSVVGEAKDVAMMVYKIKQYNLESNSKKEENGTAPSISSNEDDTETQELDAPKWLLRYLTPKIAEGRLNFPGVRLDFKTDGKIKLTGQKNNVKNFFSFLSAEISSLMSVYACQAIRVPKECHRFIIGQNGAKIKELRKLYQVEVTVPPSNSKSLDVFVEGKKDSVVSATEDIFEIVKSLPKTTMVPVEEKHLIAIVGGNGRYLAEMAKKFQVDLFYSKFPTKIHIDGATANVDAAKTHIEETSKAMKNFAILKLSIEESRMGKLIGRGGRNLKSLREKFKVHEIFTPFKDAVDKGAYLIGDMAAVFSLYRHLERTVAAKLLEHKGTLMPTLQPGKRKRGTRKSTRLWYQRGSSEAGDLSDDDYDTRSDITGTSEASSVMSSVRFPSPPPPRKEERTFVWKDGPTRLTDFVKRNLFHWNKLETFMEDIGQCIMDVQIEVVLDVTGLSGLEEESKLDECCSSLEKFFENYQSHDMTIDSNIPINRASSFSDDLYMEWNTSESVSICGLSSAVESKVAEFMTIIMKNREKDAVFKWQAGEPQVLCFLSETRLQLENLKRQMATLGSVCVTRKEITVRKKILEVEEQEWKNKCQEALGVFLSNYSFKTVQLHPLSSVERKDHYGNDVKITWTADKNTAIVCGMKSAVNLRVAILENSLDAVFKWQTQQTQVLCFISETQGHLDRLKQHMANLGSISVTGKEVIVRNKILVVEEKGWKNKCKENLRAFFSNYTSRGLQFHPLAPVERKDSLEDDVKVTWTDKKTSAVICGLKSAVEDKIEELESAKNRKKRAEFNWACRRKHVLDFVSTSRLHLGKLKEHMKSLGSVTINKEEAVISNEILEVEEQKWRKKCQTKLMEFFRKYDGQTIQFHPLSSVERRDYIETDVKVTWTANKTSAIICGLEAAVEARVAMLENAKYRKKAVSYKWRIAERLLLSFVKETASQLEELQDYLEDHGAPVFSDTSITVNGEILETSSTHEWEESCKEALNTFFDEYTIERIEVPPISVARASQLDVNDYGAITKWDDETNCLVVYGIRYSVTHSASSLRESLRKIEIEEQKKLVQNRPASSSTSPSGVSLNSTKRNNEMISLFLGCEPNKVKCVQAHYQNNQFPNVTLKPSILLDNEKGISITGRKNDVIKAQTFIQSLIVEEIILEKYGVYELLTENDILMEVIGKKFNCTLLVDQIDISDVDDEAFEIISSDEASSSSYGRLKVTVEEGDITEESVDMIVNTTDKAFGFAGPLSRAILGAAGPSVFRECRSMTPVDDIIVTRAGNLNCQHILHVALPALGEDMALLIAKILARAENYRVRTITMPTIGAGGGGHKCYEVADSMQKGIMKFSSATPNPISLRKIKIMIFPTMPFHEKQAFYQNFSRGKSSRHSAANNFSSNAMQKSLTQRKGWLNKVFNLFSSSTKQSVATTSSHFTSANNNSDSDDEYATQESAVDKIEIKSNKTSSGESAKVLLSSDKAENVEKAKTELCKIVDLHLKVFELNDEAISKLKTTQVAEIKKISIENKVRIIVDARKDKHFIKIEGRDQFASKAHDEIRKIIATISSVLPDHWIHMTKDQKIVKVTLLPSTMEYQNVVTKFLQANTGYIRFFVSKVERIQNPMLYQQYLLHKSEIAGHVKNPVVERQLFHGTTDDTVDKICLTGFDRGYAGRNAVMYGRGVYFSTLSSYSTNYAKPSFCGTQYMFLADVLTGDYCVGNSDMCGTPNNPTTGQPYDSAVDSKSYPTIFVVFKDASVYPTYIIHYQSN